VTEPAREQPPSTLAVSLWLLGLVVLQITCQLALLFEALAPLRVAFRSASFGMGLVALAVVRGRTSQHPARGPAALALLVVALELLLNPDTTTALAGLAAVALYTAIISPVFWVPRLAVSPAVFGRLVLLLWGFHTLSAAFGVLQAYFPGQFQPALSETVRRSAWGGENFKVQLASGDMVFRPMGLTDSPGGAAMSGLYSVVFGLGIMTTTRRALLSGAAVVGLTIGLFCIYLSQVRSALVLTGILTMMLIAALAAAGRVVAAARVAAVVFVVSAGAFVWAVGLGGEATRARFETLLEGNPDEIYYRSRGFFLEHTVTVLLPEYPFGAGLGRWGVIGTYFGDTKNPYATPIWAEIQWTAWLVDGGLPLVAAYALAILAAAGATARVAMRCPDVWLAGWARLILAYDAAAVALTFNSVPFIGQPGLEFWLLNAALFAASRTVTHGRST
jgi:hypothetical protein